MNKRIFIDIDGVVGDLDMSIVQLMGGMRLGGGTQHQRIIDDVSLMKKIDNGTFQSFGGDKVWEEIQKRGHKFWSSIRKTILADDIVSIAKKHGDVAFLTSPGNIMVHANNSGMASHGKTLWVNSNFNGIPLIITRDKYLCANENAYLIDDLKRNFDLFKQYGGKPFLWPNQYTFRLDIKQNAKKILSQLDQHLGK